MDEIAQFRVRGSLGRGLQPVFLIEEIAEVVEDSDQVSDAVFRLYREDEGHK